MKRSKFSLSFYKNLSCNMGELVPIGLQEVLPGDSFRHSTSCLLRVSPLLAPVMHPVHVRIHHWFVPHRLVWEDWEKFITGGPDGMDASVFPTITVNTGSGFPVGSLADYLGLPTGVDDIEVSALPFRGAALIWNEWYRDQDLQTALTIDKTSGPDTTTNTTLQNVSWEKDYFTSSRPWAQKGPDITLPLGTEAEVKRYNNAPYVRLYNDGAQTNPANLALFAGTGANPDGRLSVSSGALQSIDPRGSLYADLSDATAVSINDVREAFALQRFEENRARYGSRYTEYLRALGIRSSDARLQRPEYLGGGKQTIQFSEVLQTSPTTDGDDTEGVGNIKGHGIAAMRSNRYRKFFEEHGYVFSFISVKPRTMYVQGIPRHWNRRTKEDFWQRELQHIGQQQVLNKELYAAHTTPNGVFGYQDRYDEYRRNESSVAGEFRTTLDFWHYARKFSSDPALNASFVQSVPTDRVYASTSTDQLNIMAAHSIQARRLVAKTGSSYIL
ncbi:MAG: major capsid protein [Arizlama microvirus]|nr:MAG: major capsid protein [Arizlama microvirus]